MVCGLTLRVSSGAPSVSNAKRKRNLAVHCTRLISFRGLTFYILVHQVNQSLDRQCCSVERNGQGQEEVVSWPGTSTLDWFDARRVPLGRIKRSHTHATGREYQRDQREQHRNSCSFN